jgi:hypothetical protein
VAVHVSDNHRIPQRDCIMFKSFHFNLQFLVTKIRQHRISFVNLCFELTEDLLGEFFVT